MNKINKKKSYLFKEISRLSSLLVNEIVATTFNKNV